MKKIKIKNQWIKKKKESEAFGRWAAHRAEFSSR